MLIKSKTTIAIPPGATIKEQLEDRELSQKEFAARMGMSEKHISNLIRGNVKLTPEVAMRLEMVLGIPARFWNNLEAIYREDIEKIKEENQMDNDFEILKKIPYNEMVKNGWIEKVDEKSEKVIELRKYFEVANLAILSNPQLNKIACRRTAITQKSDYCLLAMAQKAKIEARDRSIEAINIKQLENSIEEIRNLTLKKTTEASEILTDVLSKCGIALVILPNLMGSFLQGATFYEERKIIIGMTARGKDADIFWFSLFHELGHIIKGHINNTNGTTEEDEKEADDFAKDILIPKDDYDLFIKSGNFSKNAIEGFSHKIGIAGGIVVGRLQNDGYIKYSWHNDLKEKI